MRPLYAFSVHLQYYNGSSLKLLQHCKSEAPCYNLTLLLPRWKAPQKSVSLSVQFIFCTQSNAYTPDLSCKKKKKSAYGWKISPLLKCVVTGCVKKKKKSIEAEEQYRCSFLEILYSWSSCQSCLFVLSHPVLISFTWNSKSPHLEGTLIFLSLPQRATAWPMTLKCWF